MANQELISTKYGRQAVVISVDPRRVYVADPSSHLDQKEASSTRSGHEEACEIYSGPMRYA